MRHASMLEMVIPADTSDDMHSINFTVKPILCQSWKGISEGINRKLFDYARSMSCNGVVTYALIHSSN